MSRSYNGHWPRRVQGGRSTAAWATAIGLVDISNVGLLYRLRQRGPWLGVLIGDVLGSRAPAQANHTREATIGEMIAHLGINRFGQPEEIGNLVAFLCSPKADIIAGTLIDMDGGETRAI